MHRVEEGRFTVIRVNFQGKLDELVFCFLPAAKHVLLNQEFLDLHSKCLCPKVESHPLLRDNWLQPSHMVKEDL